MSVVVALKMEGRLAGAIVTDLSRGRGRDDEERGRGVGCRKSGIYFSEPQAALGGARPAILEIQFCGEPRQGWAMSGRCGAVAGSWRRYSWSYTQPRFCRMRDPGSRQLHASPIAA